jgi:small conductance mechanosensitive channel
MKFYKLLLFKCFFIATSLFGISFAYSQEEAASQPTSQTPTPITAPTAIFNEEIDAARKLIDTFIEFSVEYSFQVIGGILILILGWAASKLVTKFVARFFTHHKVDVTVSKFLLSIIRIMIIGFAALVALGKFGITIAPFIAGLSVVGFGASFAFQGPLSNYAAGASLIFTKPFKVGHIIEVAGVMGEVQDIALARTIIKALDGTMIVVPNKQIVGDVIHNYSDTKKLDITMGVSYESDTDKAISLMRKIIEADKRIANKDKIKIGIAEFADSSINIFVRLRVRQNNYWDVLFDVNRKIKEAFNKNNITIPFPQRDVHLLKND